VASRPRALRDNRVESALRTSCPELGDVEIRLARRVICSYADGQLELNKLVKATAKEEFIEALKKESPKLAASAKLVDLLYQLHQKSP
jgi:hypothetical protein